MRLRATQIETLKVLARRPDGTGPHMVGAELGRDSWSAEKRLERLVARRLVRELIAEAGWIDGRRYEIRLYQITDKGRKALAGVSTDAA